ncbi:hypothetical protein RDWZM_002106 [Blomia tropicalis]|uniref:Solute-binding protein family 3/N-terminal domain-containing protein n=1 Tax=Blomia tropicalis TaxID=40697 RepID=A0A9Q0MCV3_BLOTA|nr:hypothetical protein RDWZM_002106 [Blomia tropicalis]
MNNVKFFGILFIASALADPLPNRAKLRGVSIMHEPYLQMKDGKMAGFAVDLMDKISNKANFDYELYVTPDGSYGTPINGNASGMVGEVMHKKADFAVADLTVTEARKRVVDFTEPFIVNHLAAIIKKSDASNLHTLEDLVKFNEGKTSDQQIGYGALSVGATMNALSKTTDPIGKSMYEWIQANPKGSIRTYAKGLDRVRQGKYAMIVESSAAEFITASDCDLKTLHDNHGIYDREYAIAVQKGSPYLAKFNNAIRNLKQDGTIKELQKTYWNSKCEQV